MSIFRYEPTQKFTRVYVEVPTGSHCTEADQDLIWNEVKRQHFSIELGAEAHYFTDAEEEAEVRAEWFANWDDPKHWTQMGTVAIDSHY